MSHTDYVVRRTSENVIEQMGTVLDLMLERGCPQALFLTEGRSMCRQPDSDCKSKTGVPVLGGYLYTQGGMSHTDYVV
jgi:hypothetical protein